MSEKLSAWDSEVAQQVLHCQRHKDFSIVETVTCWVVQMPVDMTVYIPADTAVHIPADTVVHIPADTVVHTPADTAVHRKIAYLAEDSSNLVGRNIAVAPAWELKESCHSPGPAYFA
jgi:hypothetical protein